MEIPSKLANYIATRDRATAKEQPWNKTPLRDAFDKMIKDGSVVMGGRATAGSYTDPTWKVFSRWNEVVRKARGVGIDIQETDIKQANAWATKAGGFWNESEYRLVA